MKTPLTLNPDQHINTRKIFVTILALAVTFLVAHVATAASTNYAWNVSSGNWSTSGSWNPSGVPTSIDSATFGNANESSSPTIVNNTVDSGFAGTIFNLNYTNLTSGPYVYPVTSIPSGKTLTVTNNLLVGGFTASSGSQASYAYVVGGGTLYVTGSNLLVADGSSSAGACAYLNLAGLTNFIYYNTNGSFSVSTNGGGLVTRIGGAMTFAYSNNITASGINLGTEGSAAAQGGPGLLTTSPANFGTEPNGVQNNGGANATGIPAVLTLGAGTNIINARAINIASFKNGFIVTNSGSGGLRIRGVTGADSDANVNITVGNRNAGNGGTGQTTGWLMLNGCAVDIKANAFILGKNTDTPGATATGGNGLLEFDTGTVSANSFLMADDGANNNAAIPAVTGGEIIVGANGTLNIGAGQLFAMATATGTGPSAGFLIVSNGTINCLGPLVMGACSNSVPASGNGNAIGTIQLIGSGTLNMGPNSYVGSISNPITSLLLDTNSVFSLSIPAASYTNVCVNNLAWPSPDTNLTLSIAAIPAGLTNGQVFPFLHYNNLATTNIIINIPNWFPFTNANATYGSFTSPKLVLPQGVGGFLYQSNNNVIYLQLTAGVGVGIGGVNLLTNAYFISGANGWMATGSGASIVSTNSTYGNTSACSQDTRNIVPLPNTGTNVAKLTGTGVTTGSTNIWSQNLPVYANSQIVPGLTVLSPGAKVTIGSSTYVAHEDMISGADSFYYEVDFLDTNNNLIAAYESSVLTNLNCSSPNLDQWALLAVTNQIQIAGGVNTGVIVGSVSNALVQVPPQSATATFKAVLVQRNATDSGSVYFSGANIGFLSSPVAPTLSSINPNLVTLSTNTFLTCVATSSITTIGSVQITAVTTTLAGSVTNTTVYTNGSSGLSVSGIGTYAATINLSLAANTIYQSVVVTAFDADGLSVSSSVVSFDTLVPNLVIEAADFNYSSGNFIDTPPNGGLALYQGRVGVQGIDENKFTRTNTQSYYRPTDATVIQAANSTSGTEQKFVTAAASGDTTDIEVAIAYDNPGDWLNYTRTVANSGGSIQQGTYNVWCYLATTGSGPQVGFYQVTSDRTQTGQVTNFIGNFGSSTFSDNSYNNFVYAPLVDSFGNRIELTISNGVQTFRGQIASGATPNVGFYLFVPVVPILNPIFLNVYPTTSFEPTNSFTFTVGQAQGAAISTNGIGVTLNGAPITSGLTFTPLAGGGWTVTYPILSNDLYSVVINVTNQNGLTATYTDNFDTFNLNNFHWMAVDYDFSTNNGSSSGGSVGDGWTGDLFINNPIPTGDNQAPTNSSPWELQTNSYFGYPTGFGPSFGPLGGDTLAGLGAVAHQGVDINWLTNTTQDPGGVISNSIYRLSSVYVGGAAEVNGGDGVGTQIASDSFLLPEFIYARTNNASGGTDTNICEFNVGYFYTNDWLNYTRNFPIGTFNVWGRLAAGTSFSGATLSIVTGGVGTLNQATTVLGTFSDLNAAGYQVYHWIQLLDTNGNPVVISFTNKATLRLTAPTNATPAGGALNPLFFMLTPAVSAAAPFSTSVSIVSGQIQISFPTQIGHNYTLWYAGSLPASSWMQVAGPIIGDGSFHFFRQTLSGNAGFYRVQAQ